MQHTTKQWPWRFLGCKFGLGSALELLLGPNTELVVTSYFSLVQTLRAGCCQLSYTVHFLAHITIWLRSGSLFLHRIKEDDTSKWQFLLFFSQLLWHPLIELLHLSSLLKCQPTVQWSVLNSLATSAVVVRGSAVMILSLGHCQFLMAGQCARHLQGFLSFAKLVQLPLPCMFVSSSWAKFIVDVVSCLHCSMVHFELDEEKHSDLLFV